MSYNNGNGRGGGGGRGRGGNNNSHRNNNNSNNRAAPSSPFVVSQPAPGSQASSPASAAGSTSSGRGGRGGSAWGTATARGGGGAAAASAASSDASSPPAHSNHNNNRQHHHQQNQQQQPRKNIAVWVGRALPHTLVSAHLTTHGIDLRLFQEPKLADQFLTAQVKESKREVFAIVVETKEAIVHFAEKRDQLVGADISICVLVTPFSAGDIDAATLHLGRAATSNGGTFLDCRSFGPGAYALQMMSALQKRFHKIGESAAVIPAGLPREAVFLGVSPLGRVFSYMDHRTRQRCVARSTDRTRPEDLEQYRRRARIGDSPYVIYTYPFDESQVNAARTISSSGGGSPTVLVKSVKYLKHFELSHDPLPLVLVFRTAHTIVRAMHAVHGAGLLFRCLSPLVVTFTMTGETRISCDTSFCVCKDKATMWPDLLLPRYAAPEGVIYTTRTAWSPDDKKYNGFDERSDVYSFAWCLVRLASGRQPYEMLARTGEELEPEQLVRYLRGCYLERAEQCPSQAVPDLPNAPKAFMALLLRCLSFDPAKRPTVAQLMDEPLFAESSWSLSSPERNRFALACYFRKPLTEANKAELASQLIKLQRKDKASGGQGFSLASCDVFEINNQLLRDRFEQTAKRARSAASAAAAASTSAAVAVSTPQRFADPASAGMTPTVSSVADGSSGAAESPDGTPAGRTSTSNSNSNTAGCSSADDTQNRTAMMVAASSSSGLGGYRSNSSTSAAGGVVSASTVNLMSAAAAATAIGSGGGAGAGGIAAGATDCSMFLFVAAPDEVSAEPILRWGLLPPTDPLAVTAVPFLHSHPSPPWAGGGKQRSHALTLYRFPLAAARALRRDGLKEGETLQNIIMLEVFTAGLVAKEVDFSDGTDVISSQQQQQGNGDAGGAAADLLVDSERVVLLRPEAAVMRAVNLLSLKVERSVVSALLRTGSAARRYVMLDRLLGKGASGAVYAGLEFPSHRPVAIKLLKMRDARMREELGVELGALMRMKQHANIAQVLHAEVVGDAALIVSELMSCTLDLLVATQSAAGVPETDLLRFLYDLSSGLFSLASCGLIHSDLKLANVGIGIDGTTKLLDLGCAAFAGDSINNLRGFTPSTVAPEVWHSTQQQQLPTSSNNNSATASTAAPGTAAAAAVSDTAAAVTSGSSAHSASMSPASDVYSLGVTLWMAAKGMVRFPPGTIDYSRPDWTAVRQRYLVDNMPQHVSAELRRVLLSMLDVDPARRPTAEDLTQLELYFTHAAALQRQERERERNAGGGGMSQQNSFNASSSGVFGESGGAMGVAQATAGLVQQLSQLSALQSAGSFNNNSVNNSSVVAASGGTQLQQATSTGSFDMSVASAAAFAAGDVSVNVTFGCFSMPAAIALENLAARQ